LVGVAQAAASSIKVNVVGSGGTVKSVGAFSPVEPEEIVCPGVCEGTFETENLHLIVYGEEFDGSTDWTVNKGVAAFGCDGSAEEKETATEIGEAVFGEPGDGYCVLEPTSGAVEVTTKFTEAPTPNVKLTIEEGSGTVVSNPAGLECSGEAVKSCEAALPEGKVVLTASPAPGYLFKSWKKCDTGGVNGRQCTITATSELKEIGVKFVKVWSLEGSKSGGPGILNTSPGGVNCGYACNSSTALYKEGSLTVKQKPAKHFHFVEFDNGTGSASSCTGSKAETCSFTISADSSIEEVYAEDAKNTLTLVKEGGGQGFVKTKPTNINCGYTCTAAEAEFFAAESPEVTVTLGKGTTSVTWVKGAGTCTGSALTCSVPMSESHELVAKFD
jgi:hypothetical protein